MMFNDKKKDTFQFFIFIYIQTTDGFDDLQHELEMIQKVEKQCLKQSKPSSSKNGMY